MQGIQMWIQAWKDFLQMNTFEVTVVPYTLGKEDNNYTKKI